MNDLCFNETVLIYPIYRNAYGEELVGVGQEVAAIYEQLTGFEHGNNQDAIGGASRLYLPADDDFVISKGYRLEGMVVRINPFNHEVGQQYFRITDVTPVRDILLDNAVRHVECGLTKLTDFSDASIVS